MMSTGWSPDAKMRSLLAQIKILKACSSAQLAELGARAQILRYEPGQQIVAQGDVPTSVRLVAFGRVRLVVYGDCGRELILAEVDAGGFFGDESLAGAQKGRATAIAVEETTTLSIPVETFAKFLGAHPCVALSFGTQLSRLLQVARESVAGFGLLSVEQRLLRALEQLGQEHGSRRSDGLLLLARPTHRELAARVGVRRETVTRMLDSLTRRGVVVPQGAALLLTPSALQAA